MPPRPPDRATQMDLDGSPSVPERAAGTEYLCKLKTANLEYLDDVDKEARPGIMDFLPLVFDGGEEAEEADKDWVTAE